MLDYSVSARYNPMEKNEPAKYYASAQTNSVMNLNQFAKHIATHGSVIILQSYLDGQSFKKW